MRLYVGIDLHGNNHYLGIIDEENQGLFKDEVENFNRCIKEGREPLATRVDGLRGAEISIALLESNHERKAVRIEDLVGSV